MPVAAAGAVTAWAFNAGIIGSAWLASAAVWGATFLVVSSAIAYGVPRVGEGVFK